MNDSRWIRNQKKPFWYYVIIYIGFLIIAGTGCSSPSSKDHNDRITVTFWHGMGGPLGEILDRLIAEYNGLQDRYYIRGISMGSYDTLQKKILASVVAGRSPDISQNFEALTMKLSKANRLICLDDLIARETDPEVFKADLIPVMLLNNTFDGKIWSFPFNKSVPVLYYNKDMFHDVGLDPDTPPRTIEELFEYSRKLTRDLDGDGKPDVLGYGFGLRNEWNWACRFLSYGGQMFDESTRQVFLNSPAGIQATASYVDMIQAGIAKFGEGYDHQNDWLAGKVGMFEASIVSRVYLKGKIKFNHGVASTPYGEKPAVVLSGTNINIFNNGDSDRIDGAWDFIKWFTSTDIGARWSIESTYMPVRKSSLASPLMIQKFAEDSNFAAPYQQLEYAAFEPRIPEWFECRVKISDQLEQSYIKAAEIKDGNKPVSHDPVEMYVRRMQDAVTKILVNSLDVQIE